MGQPTDMWRFLLHRQPQVTFLLHGYPTSTYYWSHQIAGLQRAGYGVIAPDLLGYGNADKPTDPHAYGYRAMCSHMIETLDMEDVAKIVAVGHDWGVALASRLATYHRNTLHGLGIIGVSYIEPSLRNTDNAEIDNDSHPASTFNLLYPSDASLWKTDFAPTDKAADFVRAGRITALPSWCPLNEHTARDRIFAKGPLSWYKSTIRGINAEDEAAIPEEDKFCPVPNLFIAAKRDYVCQADLQIPSTRTWAPNAKIETMDCGHWVQLEEPETLNELLDGFVRDVTGKE
ncbi:hypothetical protein BBP40_008947 [Aspergillus hancockii]|nr:hypothetical protein BBP40_008947 [Aspergillus hancockii]